MIASLYTRNHILNERIIMVGTLGFGVYIFHQFILRGLYYNTSLSTKVASWVLPWIGFAVAVLVSILLSILLRKTKIGKKLI